MDTGKLEMLSLAIVGSRDFHNYDRFLEGINEALEEWELTIDNIGKIVSGGAKGADSLAERFAKDYSIECKIFLPEWDKLGKKAGLLRNTDIVNAATYMIAFPSKDSKGTFDSINKAKTKNIPLKVINI